MKLPTIPEHWLYPESLTVAAQLQLELAEKVIDSDQFPTPKIIAGVDVSNNLYDPQQMVYAGVVNIDVQSLQPIEATSAAMQQKFPYRTGFLAFRETPVILAALEKLQHTPDIIVVDGHGISHPRGLGIATHLGVLLNLPTIGVAKSILVGKPMDLLATEVGSQTELIYKNKTIGTLLRSKKNSNPLIISIGHRVSASSAVEIIMQLFKGYRLPEPTRLAHLAANACRIEHMTK